MSLPKNVTLTVLTDAPEEEDDAYVATALEGIPTSAVVLTLRAVDADGLRAARVVADERFHECLDQDRKAKNVLLVALSTAWRADGHALIAAIEEFPHHRILVLRLPSDVVVDDARAHVSDADRVRVRAAEHGGEPCLRSLMTWRPPPARIILAYLDDELRGRWEGAEEATRHAVRAQYYAHKTGNRDDPIGDMRIQVSALIPGARGIAALSARKPTATAALATPTKTADFPRHPRHHRHRRAPCEAKKKKMEAPVEWLHAKRGADVQPPSSFALSLPLKKRKLVAVVPHRSSPALPAWMCDAFERGAERLENPSNRSRYSSGYVEKARKTALRAWPAAVEQLQGDTTPDAQLRALEAVAFKAERVAAAAARSSPPPSRIALCAPMTRENDACAHLRMYVRAVRLGAERGETPRTAASPRCNLNTLVEAARGMHTMDAICGAVSAAVLPTLLKYVDTAIAQRAHGC